MLSLHTVTSNSGARKKAKRVGRWNGSGKWTFSTRWMNGQNSRSGGWVPQWFEWGQTPLFRRMPKLKGFSNARFTTKYNVINISDVQKMSDAGETVVNAETLKKYSFIRKSSAPIKLLWNGELAKAIDIQVDKISTSAQSKLEKAWANIISV